MQLYEIISKFGEEPLADIIAKSIIKERAKKPIKTTNELSDIILNTKIDVKHNKIKTLARCF